MKTKLVLTEKDIKRAIEEDLIGTNQGKAKSNPAGAGQQRRFG
jgi:hypothetical protein